MATEILATEIAAEQWLPVAGYESLYEVSDLGRVRSVERTILASNGTLKRYASKVLRPAWSGGYLAVALSRDGKPKTKAVHLLVYAAFIGSVSPGMTVDHRDRDRKNNRATNFRCATLSQNGANSRLSANNTSGRKRVCWNKSAGKWQANIMVNRQQIHLGLFASIDEASAAYKAAAELHFGEFANA